MPGQFINIDRLWQGESGQAPWQRKLGTVQAATNCRFDPRLGGAVTRNPTDLIADLIASTNEQLDPTATYFWTNIRGAIIAIGIGGLSGSTSVLGWDEFGQPLTINDLTNGGFDVYLGSVVDPIRDIDFTTSFDTMIVVNRNVNTGATLDAFTFTQSFNLLKNGDAGSSSDTAVDNTGDPVQFRSDLDELTPTEGDVHWVQADENLDPAGFYIYFPSATHPDFPLGFFMQHGLWWRIPDGRDPQGNARYQDALMPHRILYSESTSTITLDTCPWRQRVSGNQSSNQVMLFENRRVRSVEFLSGRLFLVGDNSINSSRTNDFFNLWKDSVNVPQDNDPIRQLITQSAVGEALRAKMCGANLFIVAENGQLQFGATSENLTSVNGILETITDIPSNDIDPASGPSWVSILDSYGDIHQFVWSGGNRAILYQDMLTAHVPAKLHDVTVDRIFHFGTTFIAVINSDDAEFNDIFVVGGQRIQSAWGTFQTFEIPVFFNSWQGNIRIVTQNGTNGFSLLHYVHRLLPPPTGMVYVPRTDRQEIVPIGDMTYDSAADETTIPHTGRNGDLTKSILITRDVNATHEFVIPDRIDSSGDPVFPGQRNLTGQFLGFRFTPEFELSKLFSPGDPRKAQAQSLNVYHFDTTDYEVEVTFLSGKIHTDRFHAGNVGQIAAGDVPFGTGIARFGVAIDPRVSTIKIRSTSPGQFIITQVVYELKREGQASKV